MIATKTSERERYKPINTNPEDELKIHPVGEIKNRANFTTEKEHKTPMQKIIPKLDSGVQKRTN